MCLNLSTESNLFSTGSHSLMVFGTYIAGQTQFPEFSAVVMLDDLQVLYYDSITQKPVPHSQSNSEYKDTNYTLIFRDMHDLLKYRTFYVKDNWNLTDGKCKPMFSCY